MQKKYDAPELTLIGKAGEVVMGSAGLGGDSPWQTASDFEFEQDNL
jgi:hypothetical protein